MSFVPSIFATLLMLLSTWQLGETLNVHRELTGDEVFINAVPPQRYYNYDLPHPAYYRDGYENYDRFGNREGNPKFCGISVCGKNSFCDSSLEVPTCSCLPGHSGNPNTACEKVGCTHQEDCPPYLQCWGGHCIDPCQNSCGQNSKCKTVNHVAACFCPAGFTGNSLSYCRPIQSGELCDRNPCGSNASCNEINNVAVCGCLPGYYGNPLAGCEKGQCVQKNDCNLNETCFDAKCVNPCELAKCGENAQCNPKNHIAMCSCPAGYYGDSLTHCYKYNIFY